MANSQIVGRDIDATRASLRRIHAVRETDLLDTAPEETFDRLTRLAARLVNAPATFISLVDEKRDFYKSAYGFPESLASGRQIEGTTFCQYAITSPEPLVVDDVSAVPELRDCDSTRLLGARAYVGIPLVTDAGDVIGNFCAIDTKPRHWTSLDLEVLTELAESALREVRLRHAVHRAERNATTAQRATRAREEVLAVVAHDLRTPLGVIANAAFILSHVGLPDQGVHALNSMRAATGQMAALITDLLESGKFEPGHVALQRQAVRPETLVLDAAAMLAPIAGRNGIALLADVPGGLDPVNADYARVLRVFSNLVRNAIKYSATGETIWMTAEATEDGITFSVIDEGTGMDSEELTHAFEKDVPRDGRDVHGGRLGLFIAKVIVDAHGGSISAAHGEQRGNVFSFTLPLADADQVARIATSGSADDLDAQDPVALEDSLGDTLP